MGCQNPRLWRKEGIDGSDGPGCLSRCPEFVQVFQIALSVHAGPEAAVFEHAELAIARQSDERAALQDTVLVRGKIGQKVTVEEEVAAIDPVVGKLGFFAELCNLGHLDFELTEPRGGVNSQDGALSPLLEMKPKFLAEVDVGHAVTVSNGEMTGIAKILGRRTTDPGSGHGQLAGVSQGYLPVFLVVDRVNRQVVRHQLDGEVTVHRCIIEKVGLDNVRLVAEAENEAVKPVMGIGSHDVPEDGTIAYRDHGLGANLGFLAQPRAQATAKNKDGYIRNVVWH